MPTKQEYESDLKACVDAAEEVRAADRQVLADTKALGDLQSNAPELASLKTHDDFKKRVARDAELQTLAHALEESKSRAAKARLTLEMAYELFRKLVPPET